MEKPDGLKQNSLFDTESFGWWHTQLDPGVLRRLDDGIEGMIRRTVLRLMPAEEIGAAFSEDFGRPTKELYAICALMLLAEFKDWTIDETADAWSLNATGPTAYTITREPAGTFLFSHQRVLAADDLTYTLQSTTDLAAAWSPADATFVNSTPVAAGIVSDTWRITPPVGAVKFFVRLRVVK